MLNPGRTTVKPTVSLEPFSAEEISVGLIHPSAPAYNRLARVIASRINDELSPRWDICIRRSAHNTLRTGPAEDVEVVVFCRTDRTPVAEISFHPGAVTMKSLSTKFDGEEENLRAALKNIPEERDDFSGKTYSLREFSFCTTTDIARGIRPYFHDCKPRIFASGEFFEKTGNGINKIAAQLRYPNDIVITGAPCRVILIPYHMPNAYLLDFAPLQRGENIPLEQILTIPETVKPGAYSLYHWENLALPWMVELLYSEFELNGRAHYSQRKRINAVLSDAEVETLAEKMLPLPYFERGRLVSAVEKVTLPGWEKGKTTPPLWIGPVTAELLTFGVDKILTKYEEMRAARKRRTGEELSCGDLASARYKDKTLDQIEEEWENKLPRELSEWCLKKQGGKPPESLRA